MGLVAREHGIELARSVEGVQLVAAADMGFADENLRKGRARAGAIPHLLTKRRIGGDVEFSERRLLARQKRLGGAAIAAARTGIDLDGSGHVALSRRCPIIWWLYGRPQPGRTPARRRKRPWRAAAPARRRRPWRRWSEHRRPGPRGGPESGAAGRPRP